MNADYPRKWVIFACWSTYKGEWVFFYLTQRTGSPHYQYYFKLKSPITGKKKKYRGSTKSTSFEMAYEYLENVWFEIKSGKFFENELRKSQGLDSDIVSFGEIMEKFIENKLETSSTLTEKTRKEYKTMSDNLIDFFGQMEIETVGRRQLYRDYRTHKINKFFSDDGRVRYIINGREILRKLPSHVKKEDYGKTMVNREMELFFQCLNWAKIEYKFFTNTTIDPFEWYTEKRKDVYIEENEYRRLKDYYINVKPNHYYLNIIRFLVHTGLRPNELFSLTWDCVHFDRHVIEVKDRKNPRKGAGRRETTINTEVPIIGEAEKILKELKERPINTDRKNHVFVNDEGHHITRMEKSLKTALRHCNIDKNITLNVFRHQAASRFIKKGYSATYTRQILGHSPNSRVLESVYLHLDSKDLVNEMRIRERLDEDLRQNE